MRTPLFTFSFAALGFVVGVSLTAVLFVLLARMPNSQLLVAILPPTPTPTSTPTATPTATPFPTATLPPTVTELPTITPSPTVDNARESSLKNPMAVKTALFLQIGQSTHYSVEVVSSERGSLAEDLIKGASGFAPDHTVGTDVLLITVRIHYLDGPEGKPLGISKFDFQSISDNQVMPNVTGDGPEPLNGNILPGAYSVGTLTELAFKDDLNPLLGLAMGRTSDGSAGFFFSTR